MGKKDTIPDKIERDVMTIVFVRIFRLILFLVGLTVFFHIFQKWR